MATKAASLVIMLLCVLSLDCTIAALRQHSAQRAVTMSRHACQQHRSEIGQAYSHTVTASLSDHGTIYTVLRSAHGLFIPLKDAVESYYWQLQATATKSQLYLHVAAARRQVKSETLGHYKSHQQSHVMLWHKLPQLSHISLPSYSSLHGLLCICHRMDIWFCSSCSCFPAHTTCLSEMSVHLVSTC